MAKPIWVRLDRNTGSGNGTVANSSNPHTGRVARKGTLQVDGVGATVPDVYEVTQSPKPEFVSFDNGSEMSAPKTAGTVTVEGKTNSSKLTFAFAGSVTDVDLPSNYRADGTQTNNGTAISGDPGATSEFAFSIELELPENTTIEEVTRNLKVTANGGQSAQIAIKQAAGDAYVRVSPKSITIPQDGSAVSVTIESNTTWTIS